MTLSALTICQCRCRRPAGGGGLRQSLYDDDALTDGLAEAGVDVWARLGLALKHGTAAAE